MSYLPNSSRLYSATWQIGSITLLFALIATIVSGLVTYSIVEMRTAADEIDDARARRAAEVAVLSLQQQLSATVRDNAVWDDAYIAMDAPDAANWAYENWGRTSEDYQLYDGVVVTARDGSTISAHWKGVAIDPFVKLGPDFVSQIETANEQGLDPRSAFHLVDNMLVLTSSLAIQPYEDAATSSTFNILTFFKIISPTVVEEVSAEYQLRELSLVFSEPNEGMLQLPIVSVAGEPIAYLQWPRELPGTKAYQQVLEHLTAAAVLFSLFLIGILVAGGLEVRRLRNFAAKQRWNATHDRLTGLLNRAGLLDSLKPPQSTGEPTSLHLVDLDGFKRVNDAWGHAVGDELIMMVAERLRAAYGSAATIARLGGDEFALLRSCEGGALEFSQSVISEMSRPFEIGGRVIEVGASIGFAFSEPAIDPLELIRRADMSLYRAKESGRGRAVEFSRELDEERDMLASLEGQLRAALDEGLVNPVFQPLISAEDDRICGVEALARWQTEAGLVSPEVFIPLAERSGLIDVMGLRILDLAVNAVRGWPALELSVNVSPIQLCNPTFPAQIMEVIQRQDFDPRRLILEITEGVLMTNPTLAHRAMDSLRAFGVRFALDDFGCGYASIGALREFGFDRMKIDRSLVSAAQESGSGADVLEATISLASALNIPVTAEGVETATQADLLRVAGCQQLQGYLLGKPMPAEQLERLLKRTGQPREAADATEVKGHN